MPTLHARTAHLGTAVPTGLILEIACAARTGALHYVLSTVALVLCTAATSSPGPHADDQMESRFLGHEHPAGLLTERQDAGWTSQREDLITRRRRGLQLWRNASRSDRSIDEPEPGSQVFQDPDSKTNSRPVITILEPYPGAVFRERNDLEISFTVEGLRELMGELQQTAIVSTLCRSQGCKRDGWRMGHEADITQEIRVPLPQLCSVEKTCETSVKMASVPNGEYTMAVSIDYGNGRSQSSPWSTFTVDVDVELHRVLEDDERSSSQKDLDEEFSEEDLRTVARCEAIGLKVRQKPARIFDGFTYNGEIDLLQVRAEEFGDLVTAMILVESTSTFQGHVKEELYPSHAHLLPHTIRKKVRHIVEDFSELDAPVSPWAREDKQRDSILKGLDDARGQDIVIISDVDEIVKRDTILLLRVCHDFWAVHRLSECCVVVLLLLPIMFDDDK